MFSNERSDLKYNVVLTANGLVGVQGPDIGTPCFAETQIRVEPSGFGGTSSIQVQGRLRSSTSWTTLATIAGDTSTVVDVSTYDYVRYNVVTVDGIGEVIASGFFIKPSSGGGGGGAVDSVNGYTGVVVLTKADLSLGNVNNTSDANKPVSIEQALYFNYGKHTSVTTLLNF